MWTLWQCSHTNNSTFRYVRCLQSHVSLQIHFHCCILCFSALRLPLQCREQYGGTCSVLMLNLWEVWWESTNFYSKTNQMHQCIEFILFREWHSTYFGRSFRPSSALQDSTYSNQTDTALCLLVSRQQYLFDKCLLPCVQSGTADDGRKDCPKHVQCHSQNKINLIYWCIWLGPLIIVINIRDWTLWSVPSPQLQLLAPSLLRSSNCSPSLRSVAVWFQRDVYYRYILGCTALLASKKKQFYSSSGNTEAGNISLYLNQMSMRHMSLLIPFLKGTGLPNSQTRYIPYYSIQQTAYIVSMWGKAIPFLKGTDLQKSQTRYNPYSIQ